MSGKEYQPSITRNGTRIAFLWAEDAASPPQVWVQDIKGGNARALSKGGAHNSSPTWSPDASEVAFLRIQRAATEIVIAAANGSGERVLARFDQPAYGYDHRMLDWSPDGKHLVVSRAIQDKPALALSLVDAQTGQYRPLTDPGESVAGDVDPRFSTDGSKVSFLRLIHRTQQEIFTVPAGGGQAIQVTKLGRRISSHDWSSDGTSLVYACDRDGNFRLWRLRPEAGDGGKSSTALGITANFRSRFLPPAMRTRLCSALQQDRNIWRLNLQSLEWKRLIASSGQDASPQYSPSGDRICFRSDRSGEEQLRVSKPDGSDVVQITSGTMRPSVGRWSPDGGSIVFNSPETGDVWIAQGSGRSWSVKNTGVQGVHPVFSHDGAWIYAEDLPCSALRHWRSAGGKHRHLEERSVGVVPRRPLPILRP